MSLYVVESDVALLEYPAITGKIIQQLGVSMINLQQPLEWVMVKWDDIDEPMPEVTRELILIIPYQV
jgi:hypothetical protein